MISINENVLKKKKKNRNLKNKLFDNMEIASSILSVFAFKTVDTFINFRRCLLAAVWNNIHHTQSQMITHTHRDKTSDQIYAIISCQMLSHYIMSYHITSYHIIPYHITSYHVIYHIISYHPWLRSVNPLIARIQLEVFGHFIVIL